MLFSLLPEARHVIMTDYVRHRCTVLRRAAPGAAPIPVYRPMWSRFLVAGICAWLLWQPLRTIGEIDGAAANAPTVVATSAAE